MIDLLDQKYQKDRISHVMHSTLTADTLVEENKVSDKEKIYNKKIGKLERRKKKAALQRFVRKIFVKKRGGRKVAPGGGTGKKKGISKGLINEYSIRTHHEEIFESYLKLLAMPYLINHIFCFNCCNFYKYGDQISIPKKCQVCRTYFHYSSMGQKETNQDCQSEKDDKTPQRISHMSRPDFILDFNTDKQRAKYKHDTIHHKTDEIKEYQREYLSKVCIIRIDGSIHQKQSQMIKDYHQYMNYTQAGVKVFIVQNDDIDDLLAKKDAGRSLLQLCHYIGECTINNDKYEKHRRSKAFQELVRRPF